ncbi:TPA: hypothetical protein N0F65_000638 [Lagenidium giganteum]|uniref:Uncharacterized protein n=1 Tax=Lagenidium giganteum TaxID=4803 RepID=A0AAV2YPS9_9STRA|nr:TPA: hypothetical protein N0F65_000638 [Lagenidium giganteum]
MLAAKSCRPL